MSSPPMYVYSITIEGEDPALWTGASAEHALQAARAGYYRPRLEVGDQLAQVEGDFDADLREIVCFGKLENHND